MGSKEDTARKTDVPQRSAKGTGKGAAKPAAKSAGSPGAKGAATPAAPPAQPVRRPSMLIVAAVVLAAEALALLAATVVNVIDLTAGQTYQVSNGLALIVLQLIMIAGLVMLASGVLKLRPWTRTPAVMVQVLVAIVAIILLQAGRPEWGVPALVLAVAGLAGLLTPASLKALARHLPDRS